MIKAMTPKKKEVYGNIVSVRQALEKFDNKVCLLDTETTGLGRDDRIVEISIIPFDLSTMQMGKSSSTFIDPKKRIPEEASKIHNIYDKDVAGKPTFDQIMPRLFPYLSSRLVVIHNSKFDMRMILNEAKRAKVRLPSIYTLCTYNLSRHLFPGAIVKLQDYACFHIVSWLERLCTQFPSETLLVLLFKQHRQTSLKKNQNISNSQTHFWPRDLSPTGTSRTSGLRLCTKGKLLKTTKLQSMHINIL
jgi:DNA polymerase III epsilon subunit-like protein